MREPCHSDAVTQSASTTRETTAGQPGGQPVGQPGEVVLSARGLTKRFVGHTVLEDVDLELRAG